MASIVVKLLSKYTISKAWNTETDLDGRNHELHERVRWKERLLVIQKTMQQAVETSRNFHFGSHSNQIYNTTLFLGIFASQTKGMK